MNRIELKFWSWLKSRGVEAGAGGQGQLIRFDLTLFEFAHVREIASRCDCIAAVNAVRTMPIRSVLGYSL